MKAAKSKVKKKSASKKPALAVVPPPPAPAAESISFLSEGSELNEFAALKSRMDKLEELQNIRRVQMDDFRIAISVVLTAVKKVQDQFSMHFIPEGTEIYGIKF